MKRTQEYLVQKRDGRREWLRSTKLARSIHRALTVTGAGEEWRAFELASTVLAGLRQKHGTRCAITTGELATAVERVLSATGFQAAAFHYAKARADCVQRRRLLGTAAVAGGSPATFDGSDRLSGAFGRPPTRRFGRG
jgi:hypothetical protein